MQKGMLHQTAEYHLGNKKQKPRKVEENDGRIKLLILIDNNDI